MVQEGWQRREQPGRAPVTLYGAGRIATRNCVACCSRRQWLASKAAARADWEGGVDSSARQTDKQAGTPVAEIVGGRRSDDNACSGSSRVIRFRRRRSGGGGGGGAPKRSLLSYSHSKQGAAVSSSDSLSSCSGVRPVSTCLATHFTYSRLASSQAPSPAVHAPPHQQNACMRDGRMINRYTIWPALLTPAASIDAAKPSKGPGRRHEMGIAPMTVAASSRAVACDRTLRSLSSKQSDSVGVARTRPCCRSKDRAIVICDHCIQAHLLLPALLL